MADTPPSAIDRRNANLLWTSLLAEGLYRLGLRRAVICPGSRSAPLTFALAAHPGIEAIPVLDERSAAFFALGLAKGGARPVALVCTSGTAAANFLPAVVEASEGGTPLLVLTADRPPELRHCASGQAIDQQKLYGAYPRWQAELALPSAERSALGHLRHALQRAWAEAVGPWPGPVHLNCPFREPLAPEPDGAPAQELLSVETQSWLEGLGESAPRPGEAPAAEALRTLSSRPRGLLLAGPMEPADADGWSRRVLDLSRHLGWPVLADGLNPLRSRAGEDPRLVAAYDALLRNPAAAAALEPQAVLCLGDWPVSKTLRGWIGALGGEVFAPSDAIGRYNPALRPLRDLGCSLDALLSAVPPAGGGPAELSPWVAAWASAEAAVRRGLAAELEASPPEFEGRVAAALAEHLPEGTALLLGNSMPVRDWESWGWGRARRLRPFSLRGASGIDGNLSAALGLAHSCGPACLLVGDLAFLHDANALLSARRLRGSLTVVVVNNDGGGIFGMLPVSRCEPPFEEYFATPQSVDLGGLCAAHAVAHARVTVADLPALLSSPLPLGMRVLEVVTDRRADAALRRAIQARAASGVWHA